MYDHEINAEELLLKKGVKPTAQRVVITQYLLSTHCHPTADEILERVKNALPVSLSRATVYNTLKTLVEAGVIQEVVTEPGRSRYDANVSDHHHFVDTETGAVFDIPAEVISPVEASLDDKFKIDGYKVVFFGRKQD